MSKLTKRMEKLALLAGGSFKTVHDRLRIAGRLSQHLHKLNIQIQDLQYLKSSHIESYVMARREAGITPRTLQNEMAALRTILAQSGHQKFAQSERISNKALGLGNASRAGTHLPLTSERWLSALSAFHEKDEGLALTLELARAMGLRSQEAVQCCQSLKTWAAALERGENRLQVVFGTKGSRSRQTVVLEPERLRSILNQAIPLMTQRGGRLLNKPDLRAAMNYWRASAVRAGGDGALPGTGAEYKGSQGDGCDGSWSWRWSRALHPAGVWEAIMSYYVSAVSDRARNNWPKIFEQLGIFIPPNHRHGPCPCCGGKDRFRMDDLEGRGTWFCNQCGAGDGLDLVSRFFGCALVAAAGMVQDMDPVPLVPPAREKSQALNMESRIKTLLRHCESGEAPYLTTRGWRRAQWLLTERSSRTICGVHFGAGTLVLPIRNTGAQLTGAQFIHPGGKKYLLPGSHLKDCFCPVHQASRNGRPEPWAPDSKPPEGIIITEGYATALAVSCLHHFPVVAALSAHNLKNVAIAFRALWPECHLILAGDNDCSQEKNTGLLNATAAAEVVKGCVVLPADTTLSDWDEFYRHYGESISRIVFNQQLPANLRS